MDDEAIACPACGLVHAVPALSAGWVAKCARCGATLVRRAPDSLGRTAAFSLAALVLYWPANVLPILIFRSESKLSTNTVWEGVQTLYKDGDVTIAVVVFCASILIPLLKLLGLFFLVVSVRAGMTRWRVARTWMYRLIEGVGRWAMLDVFALAILVSLVKLKGMAEVMPGRGLFAFGMVVVCTLLASASFDPRVVWDREAGEA